MPVHLILSVEPLAKLISSIHSDLFIKLLFDRHPRDISLSLNLLLLNGNWLSRTLSIQLSGVLIHCLFISLLF